MRPPICAYCNKRFSTREGGLVTFILTDTEKEFNESFNQKGYTGHPKGIEWFCGEHLEIAKSLSHLAYSDAYKIMNRQF